MACENEVTRTRMKNTYGLLSQDREIKHIVELRKNRFYLVFCKNDVKKVSSEELHFFTVDDELGYTGFYTDFGPLNLGALFKYSVGVDRRLRTESLRHMAVVHYSSRGGKHRTNAAFLAGAFAVLFLDLEPEEVYSRLTRSGHALLPFRDASNYYSSDSFVYTISILHCLRAMKKAQRYNFFDFNDFDLRHYEFFQVDGYYELNWIVPDKLLAFSNPSDEQRSPIYLEYLVRYFAASRVGIVIRLNHPRYSASRFTLHGIKHYDLYFDDGTTPSKSILFAFFSLVEKSKSAVAVHCKAGLGRTGCLIGAYLMKHYRFSSEEAIAWMRICRPAMVVGNQQDWLKKMEAYLWNYGDLWRVENFRSKHVYPLHENGIYSKLNAPYSAPATKQGYDGCSCEENFQYSNGRSGGGARSSRGEELSNFVYQKMRLSQGTSRYKHTSSEKRQANSEDTYHKERSERRDRTPSPGRRPLSQGDYLVAAKRYRQQKSRLSSTR